MPSLTEEEMKFFAGLSLQVFLCRSFYIIIILSRFMQSTSSCSTRMMCAENKSLAWTVGNEQASPSLDLVTTNLASSILRCREGGASMDCTTRLGCKPMHLRRRDIHGLHVKAWMQTIAHVEERCKPRHDMKVGCEEQGGGEAGRQGEEGQGWEGPQQAPLAQPRHDSGSLRWFPRRRWMALPQPRWRPCMASASKIPCGHVKKGWSISNDSSHGATGNLMWCFHPLDIASSSAWSPFQ